MYAFLMDQSWITLGQFKKLKVQIRVYFNIIRISHPLGMAIGDGVQI